jgi:hypothetical protein
MWPAYNCPRDKERIDTSLERVRTETCNDRGGKKEKFRRVLLTLPPRAPRETRFLFLTSLLIGESLFARGGALSSLVALIIATLSRLCTHGADTLRPRARSSCRVADR